MQTFSAIFTISVFRSPQASLLIRQQIPGRNDVIVSADSSHGLTSSSNAFPKESLKKKAFYKIWVGILLFSKFYEMLNSNVPEIFPFISNEEKYL